MKASELRIGNLVIYNEMIMRISEICSPKPLKDKRYSDKYIIELFDGAGLLNCTLDELKPIQLTEEWLLKFGFEKNYNGIFKLIKDSEVEILIRDDFWTCDGIVFSLFNLKYVHQLQNLYFALANEELTIK